jgi:hypothetical protein
VRRSAPEGAYVGLAGSAVAIELVERQAMISKNGTAAAADSCSDSSSSCSSDANGGASSMALLSQRPLAPAALPVSTVPAAVSVTNGMSGGGAAMVAASGGGAAAVTANGAGRYGGRNGRGNQDPNGIRVALTAGLEDSAGGKPGAGPTDANRSDLEVARGGGGASAGGAGGRGVTFGSRGSVGGGGAGGGPAGGVEGERTWRTVLRAVMMRALEIVGMQLRTLLILGMFGLECYWAYGLIRYRGGWQVRRLEQREGLRS